VIQPHGAPCRRQSAIRNPQSAIRNPQSNDSFSPNFLLDMKIRFGMGQPMKQNNIHSDSARIIDDGAEIPSPPKRADHKTDAQAARQPTRAKEQTPKWRNLTLDELRNWYEAEKRRQGITQ
jgi:hypothetical protein